MSGKKAIVLLSGGLDSCTAAALAKAEGFDLVALSFDYGQRHQKELVCAQEVARRLGVLEHHILPLPLGRLGGSALTDAAMDVPDAQQDIGAHIPVTYVPARNTVFLAFALAVAEVAGAQDIFIGANALDYSGYPDCRPEYLAAFERMANLATKAGVEEGLVRIRAPLVEMTKAQIVAEGQRLGAPLDATWSCYRGGDKACGTCESCTLRLRGFAAAASTDPIDYEVT